MSDSVVDRLIADMVGTPYGDLGRYPGPVDCFGIILRYAELVGYPLPDYVYGPRETSGHRESAILLDYHRHAEKVEPDSVRSGDLVCVSTTGAAFNHMGVYVGNGKMLHAVRGAGVVIVPLRAQPWYNYNKFYCRLKV